MEHTAKKPRISILFFFVSLANVLGVLFSTALPSLAAYFHISKTEAQKTVSYYLIGALLAQIAYAPVAKAIGRKPAIYLGCSLTVLGIILCLFSINISSFSLMLFGRALTAFGAACGLVLTNVLLADVFSHTEQKKILSYLMTGFAVFPAISMTIGGFITEYISWQACFYFMLFYSLFVGGLCILLPETAKEKGAHHLHVIRIARGYLTQFSHLKAVIYALIVSCASIILYVFAAEAPFLSKELLHLTPDQFGLYNLIPNIGLFVGGIASARLSHRYSSNSFILIAGSGFFVFSALMWACFAWGFVNIFTLFGMPLLIFLVTPILLSQGQVSCLAASEDKVYASSSLYILQYFWMFLSISFLGVFPATSPQALPIVYSCSGFFILILWLAVKGLSKGK